MSEVSNKALIIAVSLLVTIAITSSIILVFGYFKDIYKSVDETDISLRKMFNEFDMYDNTEITGLDVINAYKKYDNEPLVNVYLDNVDLKQNNVGFDKKIQNQEFLATKYQSTCQRIGDGANIMFVKVK